MVTRFLALIAKDDYEAFRNLLHAQIPATYAEWYQLVSKELNQLAMVGHCTVAVELHPDDFTQFCAARRVVPDRKLLDAFAHEVGMHPKNRH